MKVEKKEHEEFKKKIEEDKKLEQDKIRIEIMRQAEFKKSEFVKNSPCGMCTFKNCRFESCSHFVGQIFCPEYARISKSYDFRFHKSEPVIADYQMLKRLEMN